MSQTFYASSKIDRHGDFRSDAKILNKIMIDDKTKFVPIWNGKNLFQQVNEKIEAYLLNKEDLRLIIPNDIVNPIFLGVADNTNYIGLDLNENNSEFNLWIEKKSIIIDDLRKFGPNLNEVDASFLALTSGMFYWHNTHKFCGFCGSKNTSAEGGFVRICSNLSCGKSHFPRTDPAIITLISSGDRVLLGRSPRFPEGMYSTLAGFVEPGESLEQALEREVFEEVGVRVENIRYFNSQPWPFPASLMLGFFAKAKHEDMRIDYNEIEDAQWFSIDQLRSLKHPSISGGFKLPRVDSIARRLVDTWIANFN
jgi:NAD+ diphosphatase